MVEREREIYRQTERKREEYIKSLRPNNKTISNNFQYNVDLLF